MRIAYLIDRDSLGGGMEYVRRKMAGHLNDDCHVFFSEKGECTAARINRWGAEEIVIGHVRALLQLFRNPFRSLRGRVTFVVHGIHLRKYDYLPKSMANRIRRWLRLRLERLLYHKCDTLIALTATDREDILRLYGENLNVVIEPNTLDGWIARDAENLPPGIEGPFDYVVIGRFDFQKGQDRWIGHLGKQGGKGRTLFIGDGKMLAACKKLAQDLGMVGRCVFAGAIPDADQYLKCAAVVVSPSRWEGMPYLMMKARALGCRILATDCPGNRDVLAGYEKWEKLVL